MDAAIVNVGTELLMGEIVNTNAAFLSGRMKQYGINVYYQIVVGDNHRRLKTVLGLLSKRVDLILMTGGLGPTRDDMTKEAVSEVFARPLVQNPLAVRQMENVLRRYGRTITENNYRQTFFPEGSVLLENRNGSAPGFILDTGEKSATVVCLPGPPHEMKAMFEAHLDAFFGRMGEEAIHSMVFKFAGVGESTLETELLDLIENQKDPTLATYAKPGEVTLRIATRRSSREEALKAMEPVAREVRRRLGAYLFSEDDRRLNQVLVEWIGRRGWKLSTVESCTGGLLASTFIDVPGASRIFEQGFITYSDEAKTQRVHVPPETLRRHGAVSPQTAEAMVRGLHRETGSTVCLAVTGIAGPDGGTPEKPVGLVYAAFLVDGLLAIETFRLHGDRERIRTRAVQYVLKNLCQLLKKVEQEA